MDIFIDMLPLIVAITGIIICIMALFLIDKFFVNLEGVTILYIVIVILILTLAGVKLSSSYQNVYHSEKAESYYTEIENLVQNGYIVYMNGSVIDSDKVIISDYPANKIHINDELKEIYISNGN